ncbi:MAG: glycosyltransferase family 2 protein [Pseudomonadota bacterium]
MTRQVTIIIPTFKRVACLARAVESVFAQRCLTHERPALIIVDNDPAGSALAQARALKARAPACLEVSVLHCPQAGVSNARNMALDHARTPLVAWLDDDQSAAPDWLGNLLAAQAKWKAAVTFGPVRAVLPATVTAHRAFFEAFFSRNPAHETGPINAFYGCGNALLDLRQMPDLPQLFASDRNETGGEDDLLFMHVERAGGRFAWASDAPVFEHVPARRARLRYTLARAVSYGQGPTRKAEETGEYGRAALWVAIGAAQLTLFSLLAAAGWLSRAPRRAFWLDRAAQGLGKVFWRRRLKFYGASQLPAPLDQPGRVPAKRRARPAPGPAFDCCSLIAQTAGEGAGHTDISDPDETVELQQQAL